MENFFTEQIQMVREQTIYGNMKWIKATVLENGDLEVEQILEYSFNGDYNGIYITIPTKYENKEKVISEIDDNIYNAQGVVLESVAEIKNNYEINYEKVNTARNGQNGVYTETKNNGEYKLKIYSPSQDENKKFKVKYSLKNVCVKHNDVGELYYNFIGGEWQCSIKDLSINLYLPHNTEEPKIWGHGPDSGISEIVIKTFAEFYNVSIDYIAMITNISKPYPKK